MTEGTDDPGDARDVHGAPERAPHSRENRAAAVIRRLRPIRRVLWVSLAGFAVGAMLVPLVRTATAGALLALPVGVGIMFTGDARWSRYAMRLVWVVAASCAGALTGGPHARAAGAVAGLPHLGDGHPGGKRRVRRCRQRPTRRCAGGLS